MTTDNRTEDQKNAAVRPSMTMAGYTMIDQDERDIRRIFRGELTGDEAVLQVLERDGYGDSKTAKNLRQRIAKAKTRSSEKEKHPSTRQAIWYHYIDDLEKVAAKCATHQRRYPWETDVPLPHLHLAPQECKLLLNDPREQRHHIQVRSVHRCTPAQVHTFLVYCGASGARTRDQRIMSPRL